MELSATTRRLMSLGGSNPSCWDLPAGEVVAVKYGYELFGGLESGSSAGQIGLGACVAARYDRAAMEALNDPEVPDPTVCLGFLERVSRADPAAPLVVVLGSTRYPEALLRGAVQGLDFARLGDVVAGSDRMELPASAVIGFVEANHSVAHTLGECITRADCVRRAHRDHHQCCPCRCSGVGAGLLRHRHQVDATNERVRSDTVPAAAGSEQAASRTCLALCTGRELRAACVRGTRRLDRGWHSNPSRWVSRWWLGGV
jgi:hypothetical protein